MSLAKIENGVESQSADQKIQRLFFALWPDEIVREQLKQRQQLKSFSQSLQDHPGSRAVFPGNFHITLAFLGNVNANQRSCAEQIANSIQCSSFELTIDTADYWHKPRILWVGPKQMPDTLIALATELRDGAIECGVRMDMRPYNAHVTLLRKIGQLPEGLAISPFTWAAKHFVLIESTTRLEGVRYEVIREWPLL
ncbi:MAG: RNA 2',3'-cyclic phosphodiesterase [Gammaproteobacteria bacterium]|nr:RNA 2',3'-cyclic phosphodiesterase [Gammaproteobacteria bacterium]